MSKCVVHMQKMKMSAVAGMQSHNQREHESRKNPDIDYSKSSENFDTLNDQPINYYRAVKTRIEQLDLPKAVRKDAVVYCSFIVSSDREFFDVLALHEHDRREYESSESVALGIWDPAPFEVMPEEYQLDCLRAGAEKFFQKATSFFCDRYGAPNVINGSVHLDESTPHMHLGLVPVTSDGRLSAKDLFTPKELRELQSAFAEEVGAEFDLERGKEGSTARHLTEQEFKILKAKEELENLNEQIIEANGERFNAKMKANDAMLEFNMAETKKEALRGEYEVLQGKVTVLQAQKEDLDNKINDARIELQSMVQTIKEKDQEGELEFGSMAVWRSQVIATKKKEQEKAKIEIMEAKLSIFEKFLHFAGVRELWNLFTRTLSVRERSALERKKTDRDRDER